MCGFLFKKENVSENEMKFKNVVRAVSASVSALLAEPDSRQDNTLSIAVI